MISEATQRNWKKLNIQTTQGKLTSRANKKLSQRNFIPTEYISHPENLGFIQNLLNLSRQNKWEINNILLSLAINMLTKSCIISKKHVQQVLEEYPFAHLPEICAMHIPEDEIDLLGLVYQSLKKEGDKNKGGSYYTPPPIVQEMVFDCDLTPHQIVLDPCCGSGIFLTQINNASPQQLYGVDIDSIAVMIAKINLLLKFKDFSFSPQIYCMNFLEEKSLSLLPHPLHDMSFDYIITNPPWGADANSNTTVQEISSGETFSYFLVSSFWKLKEQGRLKFLLPESILNVKTHKDIRQFILSHGNFSKITIYKNIFSKVTTNFLSIEIEKAPSKKEVSINSQGSIRTISTDQFLSTENYVFSFLTGKDLDIIKSTQSQGYYTLHNSLWALGIVTGNNKEKLFDENYPGTEEIYTGKEVQSYTLKPAKKFLFYDRNNLQQVAKEDFFRASEKLIYKFISKKLMFAYDKEQRLVLNSANILIPNIPTMSIKTVMTFLNSELYQYLYIKLFGESKILKGNLQELLFPKLTPEEDNILTRKADHILDGDFTAIQTSNDFIYKYFNITKEQQKYIQEIIYGKIIY
ncbi:MAG: N-6 DNA methylase [Akkermansia sp.]